MSNGTSAEMAATYLDTRFACRCGRFLSESAIRHTDIRDDSRFYGVRSEVAWDCSRCGTIKGEEWEPQIVALRECPIPPSHRGWVPTPSSPPPRCHCGAYPVDRDDTAVERHAVGACEGSAR